MSIDEFVKEGESYSFTEDNMKEITNNKYKLYLYEELEGVKSINELLGRNGGFLLLYEVGDENTGHYIGVFTQPNKTLEVFDSYGLDVDEEIQYADYQLRRHDGEIVPHLTHLLEQSDYKIISNKTKLQSELKDVNTCGRWVGYRMKHRDLPLNDFVKLFKNKHYTPDWFITILTAHYGSFNK